MLQLDETQKQYAKQKKKKPIFYMIPFIWHVGKDIFFYPLESSGCLSWKGNCLNMGRRGLFKEM